MGTQKEPEVTFFIKKKDSLEGVGGCTLLSHGTQVVEARLELEASLGNLERVCLKINKKAQWLV